MIHNFSSSNLDFKECLDLYVPSRKFIDEVFNGDFRLGSNFSYIVLNSLGSLLSHWSLFFSPYV